MVIHSIGKRIKQFLKVTVLFQESNKPEVYTARDGDENSGSRISDGILKRYSKDGKLKAECSYREGKLHGLSTTYFETGAIRSRENYVEGELSGLSRNYHPDGRVKSDCYYDHGKLISEKKY